MSRKPLKPKKRFQVLQRDNFTCQYCNHSKKQNPEIQLHIDHIVPVVKGGGNQLFNLVTACAPCNLSKQKTDLRTDKIVEIVKPYFVKSAMVAAYEIHQIFVSIQCIRDGLILNELGPYGDCWSDRDIWVNMWLDLKNGIKKRGNTYLPELPFHYLTPGGVDPFDDISNDLERKYIEMIKKIKCENKDKILHFTAFLWMVQPILKILVTNRLNNQLKEDFRYCVDEDLEHSEFKEVYNKIFNTRL